MHWDLRRRLLRARHALPSRTARRAAAAFTLAALLFMTQTSSLAEAAPAPNLLSAAANDASGGGAGIQAGDQVVLRFDSSTNALSLNASSVNTVLQLANGHSWRDGSSAIGSAAWSTTSAANDTLTITLSVTGGAPTVALGDAITIGPSTIRDISGANDALGNGVTVSGTFNTDELVVTGAGAAPAFVTQGVSGTVVERLTVVAGSNTVAIGSITVTRLGTAQDADTAAGGVKIYHDVNGGGTVDGGDTLLGSGSFSSGAVTIAAGVSVTANPSKQLLIVVDLAATATPQRTLGVSIAAAGAISVDMPDQVRNAGYPISSSLFTIAAPAPVMLSSTANANGGGGGGIQAGDQVVVRFNSTTNAPVISAANIDTALPLSNGHSWRDGTGAIGSAAWSTTTVTNDTLTITLSAAGTPPSLAIGDTINVGTVIKDISAGNAATANIAVGGGFGVDTLTVTATNRAPATATLGVTGTTLLQLTLTADFNQIVVTSIRLDRIGTAADGDTVAGGAKISDDLDNDGALDTGEPLLGSGTFTSGSATVAVATAVAAGTPENVLVAVDTNTAGTAGRTLGVTLTNNTYVGVSAGDQVSTTNFPMQSATTLLAAPGPVLVSAVASDANGGTPGIQAGDKVTIRFDRTTNAFVVSAASINTVLALNNGHSWRDGAGAIGSAAWSTTVLTNDTLTITLAAGSGAPSVAIADAITIGAATIRDVTGTNNASGSPPTISGAFGDDLLTVSSVSLAAPNANRGATDVPISVLTLTAVTNSVVVTSVRIDRTGTAADADTATGGVRLWRDMNNSGSLDSADSLLATGSFSSGTMNLTVAISIVSGSPVKLIVALNISSGATLLRTIGVTLAGNGYLGVGAGDQVSSTNFPLSSALIIIVAPSPRLTTAVANDASGNGSGIHAGDKVILQFDSSTNALAITAANIDTILSLNNSHSWRDGAGAIGSAVWSTTAFANDTLTITLTTGAGAPTTAVGDTITIAPGTIRDVTATNNALGSPPNMSGDFGADVLIVSGASTAPAGVNASTLGLVMERLTLTAVTNAIVVTNLRIDRLGTADDTATAANGVKVYRDLDNDGVLNSTDTLLAGGAFLSGTVTLSTPLVIATGTPQQLLIVLDIVGGAGKTIGVGLLNNSYVIVAAGDAVATSNFAVLSAISNIAAKSPQLLTAIASDDSTLGEGVHTNDTVTLVFNGPTNGYVINAGNIDLVLALNNGHSWRDGAGNIGSATWSTSVFTKDTLTIKLTAGTSAPTIAAEDTITIGANTIKDLTSTNAALGSPPAITGTFGRDIVTLTGAGVAPTTFAITDGDVPLLKLMATVGTNQATLTNLKVTIIGSATTTDFHSIAGVKVYSDQNTNGLIDAGDLPLGSAKVTGADVGIPLTAAITVTTPRTLLVAVQFAPTAVIGRTVGVKVTDATFLTITAPDALAPGGFPFTSGESTLVGPAPTIVAAIAVDASSKGSGIQTGDQVILVFSAATNGLAITKDNVNSVLALNNGHSWLSGAGAIGSAVWSIGAFEKDTLTITLDAGGGPPTIAVGDTIAVKSGAIRDASNKVDATTTPRAIAGSFGIGGEEAAEPEAVTLISDLAIAGQRSAFQSADGAVEVRVPAAAAIGDLIITVKTSTDPWPSLPAGSPIANSPFLVEAVYSATGLPPSTMTEPLEVVVTPPGGELGATPAGGLTAFGLSEGAWRLLPSWVDRESGAIHIAVRENQVVAVSAVQPRTVTLTPGWNLITHTGAPNTPVSYLFGGLNRVIDAIHRWDPVARRFESAFPFAPSHSTLTLVQPHDVLWVHVRGDASIEWATYGGALPALAQPLQPGWNLVSWVGEETPFVGGAAGLFGRASGVYRWDAETGRYQIFNAGGPAFLNTLETLHPLDGLWVYVTTDSETDWEQPGLSAALPPSS